MSALKTRCDKVEKQNFRLKGIEVENNDLLKKINRLDVELKRKEASEDKIWLAFKEARGRPPPLVTDVYLDPETEQELRDREVMREQKKRDKELNRKELLEGDLGIFGEDRSDNEVRVDKEIRLDKELRIVKEVRFDREGSESKGAIQIS